jgi:hypothetical protein
MTTTPHTRRCLLFSSAASPRSPRFGSNRSPARGECATRVILTELFHTCMNAAVIVLDSAQLRGPTARPIPACVIVPELTIATNLHRILRRLRSEMGSPKRDGNERQRRDLYQPGASPSLLHINFRGSVPSNCQIVETAHALPESLHSRWAGILAAALHPAAETSHQFDHLCHVRWLLW